VVAQQAGTQSRSHTVALSILASATPTVEAATRLRRIARCSLGYLGKAFP